MDAGHRKPLSPLAAAQAALAEANRRMLTDEQLQRALESFEQIMTYRSEMYLHLSRRVRVTVRGGMAVFAAVGIALFVLLITLVVQVEHAVDSSRQLATHVQTVAGDMVQIEATIAAIDTRMQRFDSISGYMHTMNEQTALIADGMDGLDARMEAIGRQMAVINAQLFSVTRSMGVMGVAVGDMGHSVTELARPAGMFGFLP
ncbi:MAG: hypothetical protein R3F42_07130 [Pseudomonadota bacterium]